MVSRQGSLWAIDLFCGAGGLSYGLQQAGILVAAGIDNDPYCKYPFEKNVDSAFLEDTIQNISAKHLDKLWPQGSVRVLAGCAPCQPFSAYQRGADTSSDSKWPLLREFKRLIAETKPEIVTMENVPRILKTPVFTDFLNSLTRLGYKCDWRICVGPNYGLPQDRRRLMLLASLLGPIRVPERSEDTPQYPTVRGAIEALPEIRAGERHPDDPLHCSRALSELNLKRIKSSRAGGTWRDWPDELLAPCHRKNSGSSFKNVYARMSWDEPSPTITTLAHNFGAGRFGHPTQDRPLSLREAAVLQGFPADYSFVKSGCDVYFSVLGRLIGNAVPPPMAKAIGDSIVRHVADTDGQLRREAFV